MNKTAADKLGLGNSNVYGLSDKTPPGENHVKLEKHVELYGAIERIDTLEDHANNLLCRITGHKKGKEGKEVQASECPNLGLVLSTGPDEIRQKVEAVHKVLAEIEQTLF